MPRTIQIRNVDDDVYAGLARRAGAEGISVPELLRGEANRIASQPSMAEWLRGTRDRDSTSTTADVISALDELRGPRANVNY
ncbi:MAG: antitoxin [Promicromonosporaceae bacterium]|nr:antitoxin [Promicromonosporaceae bacterium]